MLLRSNNYAFTTLWFSIRYKVPFLLLSKNGKTGQFRLMDNAEITGCHRQCLGYTASDSCRRRP